jgi:hypothetical protein
MNVLLDECVPRRLGRHLTGHECKTVPEMGWGGIKNGRLLALAQGKFDVLLTVDQHLRFQQNLALFRIAVLVVCSQSNDITDLLPYVPAILSALPSTKPGEAVIVELR